MNEHEMRSDAQEAVYAAWDREQKSKKRRAALVVAVALVVGLVVATVAGRAYSAQPMTPQATHASR